MSDVKDDESVLDRVRRYLAESAGSGDEPAEAEAIYALAPDVFLVHDRYRGYLELDVYFDASVEVPEHIVSDFASEWGLLYVAAGPCCSRSAFLEHLRGAVHVPWYPEPVALSLRAGAPS